MVAFTVSPAIAADKIYTGTFSNTAIGGYDTVSYFPSQEPVKGKAEFSTEWNGATWRFASAENLEKFKADPTKYAPQYGGYCAWAVAQGSLAKGNPNQWHIEDDKLYLNINSDIKQKWLTNKNKFIIDANQQFPSLVK